MLLIVCFSTSKNDIEISLP